MRGNLLPRHAERIAAEYDERLAAAQRGPFPEVGSFVTVPFVGKARQVAHVVGYGRSKQGMVTIKVRAWNNSGAKWGVNPRVMVFGHWIEPGAESAKHLPTPPPIAGKGAA